MEQETMTRQEVFNQVYTHLLKQNAKSTNGAGTCRYRGENGRSCAVGCLIKDEEYHPSMDGLEDVPDFNYKINNTTISALIMYKLLPERLLPHKNLLMDLQGIHDSSEEKSWKWRLDNYARNHNLNIPRDTFS